jgi:phosphoglycerate dehydrogenase-like enzyme
LTKVYGNDGLKEMMFAQRLRLSSAHPSPPRTLGLIGAAEIAAMKPTGVIMNVGRGPRDRRARAAYRPSRSQDQRRRTRRVRHRAAPEATEFFKLDNVLLSPHSADHVPGWTDQSMRLFIRNFKRYANDEPLENLVDKHAGY